MKNNGYVWKVITVLIVPAIFYLGSQLIASDKESRARDTEITKCHEIDMREQQKVNQKILVTLAEIEKDVKYLRKEKENAD